MLFDLAKLKMKTSAENAGATTVRSPITNVNGFIIGLIRMREYHNADQLGIDLLCGVLVLFGR